MSNGPASFGDLASLHRQLGESAAAAVVHHKVKQGETLFSGTASGRATGTVRQGALELSGVDAAKAMVEMIGAMRTYQSGQQAIQAIDQTLQEASTQVGSLTGSP